MGMRLVFIYGPPAAGKYTVGAELAKLLNYKFLDNHKMVEAVRQLFPFEDPALNIIRRQLQRKFRLEMYDEAAKAGVNFIITCALAGPQHFDFYRQTKDIVKKYGGQVHFVQLLPSTETLMERVNGASRKNIKIEDEANLQRLLKEEPELRDVFPDTNHLQIDNSDMSALEAAQAIKQHYRL
jgi:shikimate kinase